MTDALVLHHYPNSPFAEKIRLLLGHKGLAWHSVIVPDVAPKPDVVALTGGYRKTPFLQIGADVYCDTALIADVLEHRAPTPSIYPERQKGLARIVSQWADEKLFWAAMGYNFQGAAELFKGSDPQAAQQAMQRFADDRSRMMTGMSRLRPGDATAAYKSYLRRLATLLDEQPFLLGDTPTLADLSAYAPLWFTRNRVPSMAGILQLAAPILPWMDRMAAIGHGHASPLSSSQAIDWAAASTPADVSGEALQDDHRIALGSRVTVSAEAFGPETTEGELVAASRTHMTLRRTDERAGVVHVHFPRVGYVLKKAVV